MMKARRDPSARHSMYVLRQDGPELSFSNAVKNHDALLTSIYGSRSVDQHLTTAATTKADVSPLGNAGRPRSVVTFPPVTKSTTSSVWQPLFHHTTLVGSAAPLLATFKRDTHVQTEDEIRSDVGVQTEEAEIRPTATYKRDVLVQTGEVWVDLVPGGSEVATARHSEITPSTAGDACQTVFYTRIHPEGDTTIKKIDEVIYVNRNRENAGPQFREAALEEVLRLPEIHANVRRCEDYPTVFNAKNIKSADLSPKDEQELVKTSEIFIENRPEIYNAVPEKDYVLRAPVCKSEISLVPHLPECIAEGGTTTVSSSQNVEFPPQESDEPQECPSTRLFTTYEMITLSGDAPSSHTVKCEGSPKLPVLNPNPVFSRTLSPYKANRNSLNMDEYGHLSSCNTSERGSMVSVLDALYADSFKFESCENLDQLEEEIIRSLCTPVKELEENSVPIVDEKSVKDTECFRSVPNSVEHVGGTPSSPGFFNNMSDQQKTEWRPGGKRTPVTCDLQLNNEMPSPNNSIRISSPTKIDKRGMEARGEIIEKLMKGEEVDTHSLKNFDSNSASPSQPAEENEITVELLPAQLIASTPVILEVRRSSWSATNNPGISPKANGNITSEYSKTDNSSRESPLRTNMDMNGGKAPYRHGSLPTYTQGQDNTENYSPKTRNVDPVTANRPAYWPVRGNNELDPMVKSEVHVNLTPLNNPSTYCDSVPRTEINTVEKVKSSPPTPPPVVPPLPPPPPPPPPPQNYQPPLKISDNSVKVNGNGLCHPNSKNSSPGFFTSSPKDLMMQELAEKFQKRQKDAIDSHVVTPEDEGINRERIYLPSYYKKEHANATSPHHPQAQKESSPGSNPSFKTVWSSTNGENYIDQNGKDATHSPGNKNGIHYNNHSPQEALPEQDVKYHQVENHMSSYPCGGQYNEAHGYSNEDDTKYRSSFRGTTVLTDEPPPPGAILVDQKVIVEGDHVHTDKYYAVPVKEVLKEKTSTAKFTPAPPKYDGIGPTEDGVPTGLRQSVKKENMSNWYKTMFKSLHKAGHPHYGGYNSDPEFEREEKAIITKCATLDTRQKPGDGSRQPNRLQHGYPPSAKSTVEVYNVFPRPIEDYEPGYSSAVDNENTTGSKRFLPALNHPKPSYEFKSGYESDTTVIKKLHQPEGPHPEQQKLWYREIQRGGDIPQYGLGKLAPERPKVPVIGPAPTPPLQSSSTKPSYPQAIRPRTPPPESGTNDSGITDASNGNYSAQMQHAIHTELQRRMSPATQQTSSVVYRASPKSPSKSPDLKMFARVLYDFVSESPRELNLKKEELILVLRQLDKNWYEGEHKGAVGIFPVSYVEILPPEHVSPQMKQPLEGLAKAVYDFRAQTSVELPLKKGDTVALIRRVDQNWYEGRIHDRKGIFPATYIQIVQEPGESRSSLSPTSRSADSPHSLKIQEDSVKKSPVVCPAPPPTTYSSSHTGPTISSSPNAYGRAKKGSSLVEPVLYRALYGYNPQNADELELSEGDNVYVVEMCDDGWFVGTSVRTGVFGIFPGNYVEKIKIS